LRDEAANLAADLRNDLHRLIWSGKPWSGWTPSAGSALNIERAAKRSGLSVGETHHNLELMAWRLHEICGLWDRKPPVDALLGSARKYSLQLRN
jgi:hypothetical protein